TLWPTSETGARSIIGENDWLYRPMLEVSSFAYRFGVLRLRHRTFAALDAMSFRCLAVSFAARACPPLTPPRRPRADACGFLPSGASRDSTTATRSVGE